MKKITETIFDILMNDLPVKWDGKEAILEMKNKGGRNWRQMEWPGWYFEFKCEEIFDAHPMMDIPGPKYDNVVFDGMYEIPWDFKAHSIQAGNKVPTNGYREITQAIEEFDKVGFIIANGDVQYDEDRTFVAWHDELKGKKSQYVKDRIARKARSRMRKTHFELKSIDFVIIDINSLGYCGSFQKGMRNADGSPRNPKVMLDLSDDRIEKYTYVIEKNWTSIR